MLYQRFNINNLYFLGAFITLTVSCSPRNTQKVFKESPCPISAQPIASRLMLTGDAPTSAWLGGILEVPYYKNDKVKVIENPELVNTNPPDAITYCSALFEFTKINSNYFATPYSSQVCSDLFVAQARDGTIYLSNGSTDGKSDSYTNIPVVNDIFDDAWKYRKNIKHPALAWPQDAAKKAEYQKLEIQERGSAPDYLKALLPDNLSQTVLDNSSSFSNTNEVLNMLCADKTLWGADTPTTPLPSNCIWPQELSFNAIRINPTYVQKNVKFLDKLVQQTATLRQSRLQNTSMPKNVIDDLLNYEITFKTLYDNMQSRSRVSKVYWNLSDYKDCTDDNCKLWLGTILQNSPALFTPEKATLVASYLQDKIITQEELDDFGSFRNDYMGKESKALVAFVDAYKKVLQHIQNYKPQVAIWSNHLTTKIASPKQFVFKSVPLFNATNILELSGITATTDTRHGDNIFISREGDNLNQSHQTGSIITLGNFPILALSANQTHSDGAPLMPPPLAQNSNDDDSPLANPNCPGAR